MKSLAEQTVERLQNAPSVNKTEEGSPLGESLREVWRAAKGDDFAAFAEAFQAAVQIVQKE